MKRCEECGVVLNSRETGIMCIEGKSYCEACGLGIWNRKIEEKREDEQRD